jgi:phospho-N-acetylmuramoyl-pentapeptide-transferase
MGGVLICWPSAFRPLVSLSNRFVWIVLIVTLGFGAIGWADGGARWSSRILKACHRAKYLYNGQSVLLAALLVFSISAPICACWVVHQLGAVGFDVNLPKAGLLVPFVKRSAIRWVFSALSS